MYENIPTKGPKTQAITELNDQISYLEDQSQFLSDKLNDSRAEKEYMEERFKQQDEELESLRHQVKYYLNKTANQITPPHRVSTRSLDDSLMPTSPLTLNSRKQLQKLASEEIKKLQPYSGTNEDQNIHDYFVRLEHLIQSSFDIPPDSYEANKLKADILLTKVTEPARAHIDSNLTQTQKMCTTSLTNCRTDLNFHVMKPIIKIYWRPSRQMGCYLSWS